MAQKQASTEGGSRLVANTDFMASISITDITFAALPAAVSTALGSGGAGLQLSNDFRIGQLNVGGIQTPVYFSLAAGSVAIT